MTPAPQMRQCRANPPSKSTRQAIPLGGRGGAAAEALGRAGRAHRSGPRRTREAPQSPRTASRAGCPSRSANHRTAVARPNGTMRMTLPQEIVAGFGTGYPNRLLSIAVFPGIRCVSGRWAMRGGGRPRRPPAGEVTIETSPMYGPLVIVAILPDRAGRKRSQRPDGCPCIRRLRRQCLGRRLLAVYLHCAFRTRTFSPSITAGTVPSAGRPSADAILEDAGGIYDGSRRPFVERVETIGLSLGQRLRTSASGACRRRDPINGPRLAPEGRGPDIYPWYPCACFSEHRNGRGT